MYRKTLELDPDMGAALYLRTLLYLKKGTIVDAAPEVEKLASLAATRGLAIAWGILGYINGKTGRGTDALSVLGELRKRATTDYVPPSAFGHIYLGLDRSEAALGELERAFARRDVFLVWLKVHPIYDEIRDHPRFQALLHLMKFPE